MNKILQGDCLEVLKTLEDESVDMVMTSPPYWALRDYCVEGQLGLESTFQEYITKLCDIFDEVKRVLKNEGTCWVNLGDTYGTGSGKGSREGSKQGTQKGTITTGKKPIKGYEKSLCQIPSRFAIEMTNRGWILRNELIWHKPNCMPSSVKDRFTVDFEKIFFFSKSKNYYFETQYEPHIYKDKDNLELIGKKCKTDGDKLADNINWIGRKGSERYGEFGRNKRCVWKINTKGYSEAHFAVYPKELCVTPINAGCPEKGIVLDPFFGSGTTGLVAQELNRNWIGIELNKEYIKIAENRLKQKTLGI